MRYWLACLIVAGCYNPSLQPGSPCSDTMPCPAGLVCSPGANNTCQLSLTDASPLDSPDAPHLIDGCTPAPEICGNGIDEDCDGNDPACVANDQPGGAIDISAGGDFMADVRYASNDGEKSPAGSPFCGAAGGRDVFYKIHLTNAEAYYLDTFGSDFDTVIRIYPGACIAGPAPGMGQTACHNDQCSTKQTQGIWDLPAGDSCVVVDQYSDAETKGMLKLHVERGHRSGQPIAATITDTTTGGANRSSGSCVMFNAPDLGYYFTGCPGDVQHVTATTCNVTTTYDDALYARSYPNGTLVTLDCTDDDGATACPGNPAAASISFTASGAHLFWIIVDGGGDGENGPFELDTTFN